jgi:uncharacterized C2H2 Zn-finger protein
MNGPPFKCPDCDKTFEKVQALGPHRQKAHGYRLIDGKNDPSRREKGKNGISPLKGKPNNAQRIHAGKFPCTECDFVAQWKGGLANHMRTHRNKLPQPQPIPERTAIVKANQDAQSRSTSNGNYTQADYDRDHRIEAAATFAAGRVTELLQSVAISYDIAPRTFAVLVLRTLGKTP